MVSKNKMTEPWIRLENQSDAFKARGENVDDDSNR